MKEYHRMKDNKINHHQILIVEKKNQVGTVTDAIIIHHKLDIVIEKITINVIVEVVENIHLQHLLVIDKEVNCQIHEL